MTPGIRTSRWLRCALALAIAPLALSATAQTAGTYTGSNAQGGAMKLVVANAAGGGLEVRTIEAAYQLVCEHSGQPVSLWSTVSGYFPVDGAGQFDASYLWDRDYFRTTGRLTSRGTVAGDTAWSIAAVERKAPHPAEVCPSGTLAWSGTAAAARGAALPAGAVSRDTADLIVERRFDRSGRLLSETIRRAR